MALVVDPRFNGPPGSGHGGWSAGLLAEALGGGPLAVSLLRPPPLGRPLELAGGEARDGDEVVLRAEPAAVEVELRPPLSVEEARDRQSAWRDPATHPFPSCFACGPLRDPGDGLRLFPGRAREDGTFGVVWTPSGEWGDPVPPRLVWAAMDCPTAAPVTDPPPPNPCVLARFAVDVRGEVRAGADHVIGTWTTAIEGRKRRAAGVLWDAGGAVLAAADALWIELRPR